MAKPLRIIHCFRSPVGGIFRHVRDLAEQHSRAGHHVGIVCDSLTGGAHEDALFDEIKPFLTLGLTRMPIRRSVSFADMPAIWRGYRTIKSLRPDVLHGHGAKGGMLARVIGTVLRVNKYRVARVYTAHGGSLHFSKASLKGRAVFTMERLQERLTDALIFICDFERHAYEAKVGPPSPMSRLVYNGINERDFRTVPTRSDSVDFVYIGMLRDLKGPDLFIEAFGQTERLVGRPLSALLIGDGQDREKYMRMIVAGGLYPRVGILPAMRIEDALSMSQTVVVPSRAESMPYIVLEALAASKGVIASAVGGIPEVLGATSEGLAKAGNVADLARIMAASITEPDWRIRAMPGLEMIHKRFSAPVMAGEVLKLYTDILDLQASS
ncbi:glycosyltransferase family 4 protein [Rhizobium sp. B230/85]|uniref:glycosyltransferase family 4 protein n=1 Tax=unclassified Rhizobium TaxID=2613769 RepID=UPI001ADB04EF|nr:MULTISPECIES: glycosyltransferase family 4 protein [unclassified Rhizobium]MBO9133165.1 glycosyltransferase family 4 protein [Rhizobium sp. B209b/85]MBO9168203.1 glycosyltransferase family 4 protein [Rhizobium sp. L245/93]QXZ97631.1 glycosyltransferase family 4 protein [Rhizobium sp. B230/85]